MSDNRPRLVVGPANIALAPEFVLIDTYAKAVEYFGERGAERYRAIFEDPHTTTVLRMRPRFDEEKPPTTRTCGYESDPVDPEQ